MFLWQKMSLFIINLFTDNVLMMRQDCRIQSGNRALGAARAIHPEPCRRIVEEDWQMTTERKADKWLDRKLERRTLLKKAAIGGASLAVLYVAPKFTSAGSRPAYASTGVDGCTPGFWKNSHHHIDEQWALSGYGRGDLWTDVFGSGLFTGFPLLTPVPYPPTLTLNQALEIGGGCPESLVRHAVGALLNAGVSGDVGLQDDIKADTNGALGGGPGNCAAAIEPLKEIYVIVNEGACLDVDP